MFNSYKMALKIQRAILFVNMIDWLSRIDRALSIHELPVQYCAFVYHCDYHYGSLKVLIYSHGRMQPV